jgi:tetratricopeptide (TPR) repeat protein
MGRLPDALVSIEHAAELDPLSAQVQSTFGRILYRARRFDDAVGRLRRAIELEPRNAMAYGRLADVYSLTGRLQEALQLYEKAGELSGGTGARYHGRIACAYVRMGREPDARRLLSTLNVRNASAVHTALGEVDEAFALLFGEIETKEEGLLFIKTDPDYDRLHDDPRWRALLDRMRLG